MKLYDKLIENMLSVMPEKADGKWKYNPLNKAPDGEKNAVIFRNETAFELGPAEKKSLWSVLFTSKSIEDEILLYGKDIPQLDGDSTFAHIVTVSLHDKEEFRYEELKDIEFSVYRVYPEGYNVRISPSGCKESVRVSRKAKQSGLSFENIGCSYIEELKKNPLVKNVRVIFVTLDSVDIRTLSVNAKKASAVTKTLASDFDSLNTGCADCVMKPVCDEIEGLRELHFKKKKD